MPSSTTFSTAAMLLLCTTAASAAAASSASTARDRIELLHAATAPRGTYSSCRKQAEGVCINTKAQTCTSASGATLTGKCPGSKWIKCCEAPNGFAATKCPAEFGCMIDEHCQKKGGKPVAGLCPGPANIKCCGNGTHPSAQQTSSSRRRGSRRSSSAGDGSESAPVSRRETSQDPVRDLRGLATSLKGHSDRMQALKDEAYGNGRSDRHERNLFNMDNLLSCAMKKPELLSVKGWTDLEDTYVGLRKPMKDQQAKRERNAGKIVAILRSPANLDKILAGTGGGDDAQLEQLMSRVLADLPGTKASKTLASVLGKVAKESSGPRTIIRHCFDGRHSGCAMAMYEAASAPLAQKGKQEVGSVLAKAFDVTTKMIWDVFDWMVRSSTSSVNTEGGAEEIVNNLRRLTGRQDPIDWNSGGDPMDENLFFQKLTPRWLSGKGDGKGDGADGAAGPRRAQIMTNFRRGVAVYALQDSVFNLMKEEAGMKEGLEATLSAVELIEVFEKKLVKGLDGTGPAKNLKALAKVRGKLLVKIIGKFAPPLDLALALHDLYTLDLYKHSWGNLAGKGLAAVLATVGVVAMFFGPAGMAVAAVVGIAVGVVSILTELFTDDRCQVIRNNLAFEANDNSISDDIAAQFYINFPCSMIIKKKLFGPQALQKVLSDAKTLLSGVVMNRDENAVLKLLQCIKERDPTTGGSALQAVLGDADASKCSKVKRKCPGCVVFRKIVESVTVDSLLSKLDGSQDRTARRYLGHCDMVPTTSDNVARAEAAKGCECDVGPASGSPRCKLIGSKPIGTNRCTQDLTTMRVGRRAQLMNNMFSGFTGNADENAVIKLWKCAPDAQRNALATTYGMTYTKFESKFHGSQWRTIKPCLEVTTADAATDDDISREWVKRSNCKKIASTRSKDALAGVLGSMLSGWTGGADERAINKVFTCLKTENKCDFARELVNHKDVQLDTLLWRVDFSNGRQLKRTLRSCGIFASSDDDASRAYIRNGCECPNGRPPSASASRSCVDLSNTHRLNAIQLIRNMMDGVTGNADENAILKLWKCLSASTRKKIQSKPEPDGVPYETFDSNFHGSQWREIKRYLIRPTECFKESGVLYKKASGTCKRKTWGSCNRRSDCENKSCYGGKCICDKRGVNECECVKRPSVGEICSVDQPEVTFFVEERADKEPKWIRRAKRGGEDVH